MSRITVGTQNGAEIEIYYEDHGSGTPVVLIHGYPLNGHSWERQERVLLQAGYRVITYDRRGFGRSSVAAGASPYATHVCVDTWLTDFRRDLPKIDVPVLVVHGTEDRILPIDATANRLPDLIKDVRLVRVDGGPHNIAWTHPDEVNEALLAFLSE